MIITILGKGESLEKLNKMKDVGNSVILVNEFWDVPYITKPYYKDEYINSFLKNKDIILFSSRCCNINNIDKFLSEFNVIDKIFTIPKFESCKKKGLKGFNILDDKLTNSYRHLCANFGNTGSLGVSILHSIFILNMKTIVICGLDFYEKDYLIKHSYSTDNEKNKSQQIKKEWFDFFSFYSYINFIIYTNANVSGFNLKNVIIY